MGGRWPYSCCFVGCCFQDLFNTARSILVQFPSSFFSIGFVSVNWVHPYSRIDTIVAWKKLRFILLDRSDFHLINDPLIAVHAYASRILMSFSVDETLLSRYVNLSTDFRELPFSVEMSPFRLKHMHSVFICIHKEANVTCCLLQAMLQEFGLGRCICKKRYVIYIICDCNSFCGVSSASCLFFLVWKPSKYYLDSHAQSYSSKYSYLKLIGLDRNTWYHITPNYSY